MLQEVPNVFWPVVQFSGAAAVSVYVGIYVWWKHVPHYAHRQRIADIQVGRCLRDLSSSRPKRLQRKLLQAAPHQAAPA